MPETMLPDPLGVAPAVSPEPVPQEFPAAQVATLGAEATSLESLVHHKESVEAGMPLEIAHRAFRDRGVEFMAVVRGGCVIGLCSRGQIGFVMGSRFGFALYGQSPVETVLVEKPLIVSGASRCVSCWVAQWGGTAMNSTRRSCWSTRSDACWA
jgi:hypothetical protein